MTEQMGAHYQYATSGSNIKTCRVNPNQCRLSIRMQNTDDIKNPYSRALCRLSGGQPCLTDEKFWTNHRVILKWAHHLCALLMIQMISYCHRPQVSNFIPVRFLIQNCKFSMPRYFFSYLLIASFISDLRVPDTQRCNWGLWAKCSKFVSLALTARPKNAQQAVLWLHE